MCKPYGWALGALAATLAAVFCVAAPAQAPQQPRKVSLRQMVSAKSRIPEPDVVKVLEALGPAIRQKLSDGEVIELPGLGTFRVVRIPEHKDLIQGRPGMIAATNNVEFLPVEEIVQASNSPNAVPAVTVPAFQFNPLPDQTPGLKMPSSRQPIDRIR